MARNDITRRHLIAVGTLLGVRFVTGCGPAEELGLFCDNAVPDPAPPASGLPLARRDDLGV